MHSIIIRSSYSPQHVVHVLHEAQVENNENNRNNFDELSNSFSTYMDDSIEPSDDGQRCVFDEIQQDSITEDQEEVEDMNYFNL